VALKNLLAIDRNPVRMFSYFIRFFASAGGCGAHAFLTTPGLRPGFAFWDLRPGLVLGSWYLVLVFGEPGLPAQEAKLEAHPTKSLGKVG
jgi:hypothetical protein